MNRLVILVIVDIISLALLLALLMFLGKEVFAYELLKPDSITLEGEKYDNLRDPYIPEDTDNWVYGSALGAKFTLLGDKANKWRTFYDPTLSFRGSTSQIREGALYYEMGGELTLDRTVRIFRRHESRHVMDRGRVDRDYPLLDSYVLQIKWEFK